jgi:hypothetical protein
MVREREKGERSMALARRGTLGAALAVAIAAASVSASASEISLTSKERASLEMRVMQSELMVAALSCSSRDSYNAFVTRYQSQLVDHGKTMQNLFKRLHGGNAFNQINAFVTRMANEASLKMIRDERFCAEANEMFQALLQGGGATALDDGRSRYRCMPITGFGQSNCTLEARGPETVVEAPR